MSIQNDIAAYKQVVNNDVSTQTDPNSIAPNTVGSIGIDLADIILPELLKINGFVISGGAALPTGGTINDVYLRSALNAIQIYRNINNVWQQVGTLPLGVTYPDGILIGLRTQINAYIVTVSPGSWAINNVRYNKDTQTQLTVSPQDINYGRWDLIYADSANAIGLVTGVASTSPVKPALPANSILVDYVYVPNVGVPFLLSGTNASANVSGSVVKSRTPVDDGQKVINWQTDIVPFDTITYSVKHGNDISEIKGFYDAGGGAMTPYEPNYSFTLNGDNTINTLTVTELFAGYIIII